MKRYFRKKVCVRCGEDFTPIVGNQKVCSECKSAYTKEYEANWRKENPDKVARSLRKYSESHRKEIRLRDWISGQTEKRQAQKKKANRKWLENNQQVHCDRVKVWRASNREKVREMNRRRALRKRNIIGHHTLEEWKLLKERYNNRCACCGGRYSLTRDHIKPISLGGSDNIDNIQPLCSSCNSKKHTKEITYAASPSR